MKNENKPISITYYSGKGYIYRVRRYTKQEPNREGTVEFDTSRNKRIYILVDCVTCPACKLPEYKECSIFDIQDDFKVVDKKVWDKKFNSFKEYIQVIQQYE